MPARLRVLRLLHPFPSILVSALTVALVPLANSDARLPLYLELGLGMLCYQFAIGVANDVVDARDDAVEKPWKPIAAGLISRRVSAVLGAALAVVGALATVPLGLNAWLVGLACLACGLSYDLYFKRSPLSWLPWAIAFPLIPTWTWTSTGEWEPFLLWAWPLGALYGFSLHLANQAPDAEGDAAQGIRSTVQLVGVERAHQVTVLLFGLATGGAAAVVVGRSGWVAITIIAAGFTALLARGVAGPVGGRADFPIFAIAAATIAVAFMSVL